MKTLNLALLSLAVALKVIGELAANLAPFVGEVMFTIGTPGGTRVTVNVAGALEVMPVALLTMTE